MRVKLLVDTLSGQERNVAAVWHGFALLAALIAGDNILWRVASWVGNSTFVNVTGDVRRDLFRHLTGHAPSYFSSSPPGTLTSRVTATSNALFTVENMLVWNVLPPCMATVWSIALVATVSYAMAACLVVVAALVIVTMFRAAAAGRQLHHEFAYRAAAVDGELTDVVGNMTIVKAFGGISREHRRFDAAVDRGDGGPPAQPALPRAAAHRARARYGGADHRPAGLGAAAVAAGARRRLATSSWCARLACPFCTRRATSPSRWSM